VSKRIRFKSNRPSIFIKKKKRETMIFRDTNGNLITVCRYDFTDDKSYYTQVMRVLGVTRPSYSKIPYSEQLIRNVLKGNDKKHQKNERETKHVTAQDIRS